MLKLFVLVRKDIPLVQQAVQSGHAVAAYLRDYRDTPWDNGTLVFLGVEDEEDLLFWKDVLNRNEVDHSAFYEPDISSFTAVSFVHDTSLPGTPKWKRLLDRRARLLRMEAACECEAAH